MRLCSLRSDRIVLLAQSSIRGMPLHHFFAILGYISFDISLAALNTFENLLVSFYFQLSSFRLKPHIVSPSKRLCS